MSENIEKTVRKKGEPPCKLKKTTLAHLIEYCQIFKCIISDKDKKGRNIGVISVSHTNDRCFRFCLWKLGEDNTCRLIQRFQVGSLTAFQICSLVQNSEKVARLITNGEEMEQRPAPTYVT